MRAALDDLAATAHRGRRVAVLGDMLELGPERAARYHRELGEQAPAAGVELLVTVGPRAAEIGERVRGRASTRSPTRQAAAAAGARAAARGRHGARQGLARRSALERVAGRVATRQRCGPA